MALQERMHAGVVLRLLGLGVVLAGCGGGSSNPPPADAIYQNGTVETMDGKMSTAQAVAVRDGAIVAVGSKAGIGKYRGAHTEVHDLQGATLLPGFIDTHSHMLGSGAFANAALWVDISNVNVLLKPPAGDPRCADSSDYQHCFVPVQTQDDVIERLTTAVANAPSTTSPILAFNYDPSRLGHSRDCGSDPTQVGFACPNFEDGHAIEYLDAISTTHPILITSESGHIVYVNSLQLEDENICPPGTTTPVNGCTVPSINPLEEEEMAAKGQLNEDLAVAAIGKAAGGGGPETLIATIKNAVRLYAEHGFTFTQEGAASFGQTLLYDLATSDPDWPATSAMLIYDPDTPEPSVEVAEAQLLRDGLKHNPNLIVAGPKLFADGSTQGLTGYVGGSGYLSLFNTLYSDQYGIWPQPYVGAADFSEQQLAEGVVAAHDAGFAAHIHQNGNAAIQNAIEAMQMAGTSAALRDVMIHFSAADSSQIAAAEQLGLSATFLTPDLYYYGLPFCQQILGPERTAALYPAASSAAAGIHISLHSDCIVTPPYPLFMIWVAVTRRAQQPSWYPNLDPTQCPAVMGPGEALTVAQGIKAFTIDAAWQYGLDGELGSIEVGKKADFVVLSADPLAMESTPDALSTIWTIGTVYRGRYFPNASYDPSLSPIWPE